jgi:hypothetical protein
MEALIEKRKLEEQIQALVQAFTDETDLHIEQIEVCSQINNHNKRIITKIKALLDTEVLMSALE